MVCKCVYLYQYKTSLKNAIVGLFGLSSVLSHTDSTENTNVEPNSALLLEFFKNTNSSNDTNVEPDSALLYELFKNTNS